MKTLIAVIACVVLTASASDYLYPNREELLEEYTASLRTDLARLPVEAKQAFMSELTGRVLAP